MASAVPHRALQEVFGKVLLGVWKSKRHAIFTWRIWRKDKSTSFVIWKMWREICNKTKLDAKFYIQTSRKVDFYPRLYRILPNPWQPPLGRYYSSELWSTGCYNVLQRIHKSCSIVWMVCCSLDANWGWNGERPGDLKEIVGFCSSKASVNSFCRSDVSNLASWKWNFLWMELMQIMLRCSAMQAWGDWRLFNVLLPCTTAH